MECLIAYPKRRSTRSRRQLSLRLDESEPSRPGHVRGADGRVLETPAGCRGNSVEAPADCRLASCEYAASESPV